MFDGAATIAIVGVLATTVGGLIWVLKYVFSELKPVLDQILVSTQANTKATELNTETTRRSDEYLRQRNGRDNEIHTELLAGMQEIPNAMHIIAKQSVDTVTQLIESSKNVSEQHVDRQIVDQRELKT